MIAHIKNIDISNKHYLMLLNKKLAAILYCQNHYRKKDILKIIRILPNQLSNAIKSYRSGKYENVYIDRRGKRINNISYNYDEAVLRIKDSWMRDDIKNLKQLQQHLYSAPYSMPLSITFLRNITKYELGGGYKFVKK